MPLIHFQPLGLRVEVPPGASVLDGARLAGGRLGEWAIPSTCGGEGTCGRCRVRILSGEVSGVGEGEVELLARRGAAPGMRLACRAKVLGDVRVGLERAAPGERLQVAWTVPREGGRGRRLVAGELPADPGSLGLAVDLGTTKLAAYLVDLATGETLRAAARSNPQITFGADVITRLQFAMRSPADYRRLRAAALRGIGELSAELCRAAGAGVRPARIRQAVVCGNTAMQHLLLGLDPTTLATAPYVPALTRAVDIPAAELEAGTGLGQGEGLGVGEGDGLGLAPATNVHVLPAIAGYVGGDHVAALLATDLPDHPGVAMLIDIGTNTEIALAQGGRVTCCSCASGPAFEGGRVSRGMRALEGAVDRVWLEGREVRYSVIGGGEPAGYCGAGAIDLLAAMLATGAMDKTGRLQRGAAGVEEDGVRYVLGGVPLTQADVRELQLAKAAVRSGMEALLAAAGLRAGAVERVFLAGAFGVALDPPRTMAIGMFPELPLDRFTPVGNAAGLGAVLALVSSDARREAAAIASRTRYLELIKLPDYQELYLSHLGFPGPAGPLGVTS